MRGRSHRVNRGVRHKDDKLSLTARTDATGRGCDVCRDNARGLHSHDQRSAAASKSGAQAGGRRENQVLEVDQIWTHWSALFRKRLWCGQRGRHGLFQTDDMQVILG